MTDPVWPNSVFPEVSDPQGAATEVIGLARVDRVVVQMGCDSDPRFLEAVPKVYRFLRVCWLEYASCSHKGRLLYTGDVAYVFGSVPRSRPGARVLPGRIISTRPDFRRGTGRRHKTLRRGAYYRALPHPCPRHLQHVQWLVKWFGGASVLDPFAGLGTTLLAARACGVRAVECFCDRAVKRLRGVPVQEEIQRVAQGLLFPRRPENTLV